MLSQMLYSFPNCKKLPLNISCHIRIVDDMESKQKTASISLAVDFCKNLFYPKLKIAKFCIKSCIEPGTIAYHKPLNCYLLQKLHIALSDLDSFSQEVHDIDQLGAIKTHLVSLLASLGHQVVHNIDLILNLGSQKNLRKTHLNIFYHSSTVECSVILFGQHKNCNLLASALKHNVACLMEMNPLFNITNAGGCSSSGLKPVVWSRRRWRCRRGQGLSAGKHLGPPAANKNGYIGFI
jgi:hypothetical protein